MVLQMPRGFHRLVNEAIGLFIPQTISNRVMTQLAAVPIGHIGQMHQRNGTMGRLGVPARFFRFRTASGKLTSGSGSGISFILYVILVMIATCYAAILFASVRITPFVALEGECQSSANFNSIHPHIRHASGWGGAMSRSRRGGCRPRQTSTVPDVMMLPHVLDLHPLRSPSIPGECRRSGADVTAAAATGRVHIPIEALRYRLRLGINHPAPFLDLQPAMRSMTALQSFNRPLAIILWVRMRLASLLASNRPKVPT